MAERRIKVYIVDDDLSVRLSLSALLSAHGLLPRAFASAEEFLAAYKETRDACLLLDLRMPGMGGMALQQELINRQAHLPVIILTAHGDVPLAVEAMKAGAIDFIEKPGSEEHILNAIQDATRHRDARTARARGSGSSGAGQDQQDHRRRAWHQPAYRRNSSRPHSREDGSARPCRSHPDDALIAGFPVVDFPQ
jgi:FixJ family two-component response regulator